MKTDELSQKAEKAANGDTRAFSELYSLYATELYRFAMYYLHNPHDAQDAVQDAVLSAFKNIKSLKNHDKFKAWLFRILANVCKQYLLSESRHNISEIPVDELFDLADESAVDTGTALAVRQAIASLPERDRTIVLLSVTGGYNSGEIAAMLGLRAGSVRSILSRSFEKLRSELN